MRDLESLVEFESNNADVRLPRPLRVQLPAVCLLFLRSAADAATDEDDDDDDQRQHPADKPIKLDLVNWLYVDERERTSSERAQSNANQTKSKRHAGAAPELLLPNYIYDRAQLHQEASNYSSPSNGTTRDEAQVERVRRLVEDPRFRAAIESNRKLVGRNLSPVILVPGLLGSRLRVRIDKTYRVNILCPKRTASWQHMWLSLKSLLPFLVDCWLDNARLEIDTSNGLAKSPKGIEVQVADFGSVESVRVMDPSSPSLSKYFGQIIEHYERLGYTADDNLFAAPYDFRLAPQQLDEYFSNLRQLIEFASAESRSRSRARASARLPATLVCHSMGCSYLYIFLRNQSSGWRKANVRKLIALSAPWRGAFKALKALIVGDQLELPLVNEGKMRKLARTFPSIAFLLPRPPAPAPAFKPKPKRNNNDDDNNDDHFGEAANELAEARGSSLVETPKRQYKAWELGELLRDLQLGQQLDWFQRSSSLLEPLEPIGDIETECVHSLNTPTMKTIVFREDKHFPDGPYELLYGQGDGTVNDESLLVCRDWAAIRPDLVRHTVIWNTNHVGVLSHEKTLQLLSQDVMLGRSIN